jgi:NAD(P)-dependent dehydrogenase (short-subunit alcohol dehydrogenase family)
MFRICAFNDGQNSRILAFGNQGLKGGGMEALSGKLAIVTGAGQGVGRGIALALARRGASIALLGRTKAKLDAVVREIEALCASEPSDRKTLAVALCCDVKDGGAIREAVDTAVARLGGVDILVNNAQEVPLGPLLAIEDEAFEAGFTSGPLACLRFMKACQPHMKRRGGGVIFNLASSAAMRWDMAGFGAYGAVKEATRVLTRAAAAEWGADGVRVLTIAPHANSPSLKAWIDGNPVEAEAFFRTIPLRRIGDCEADIGNAVAALCGPEFAYLTGATIPLDGGQARFV